MCKKVLVIVTALLILGCGTSVFSWPTVYPTGVTIYDPNKAHDGYTLFVPISTLGYEPIRLVDMEGNVVHEWNTFPGHAYLVKPLSNGKIMWNLTTEHWIIEADWDGNVLWWFENEEYELHHDFQRLENGNTLILARKKLWKPQINPLVLTYDFVFEVSPNNEIVWAWDSSAHFDEFGFSSETKDYIYNYSWEDVPKVHTAYRDLYHTNSIQALPPNPNDADPRFRAGNILMSQRNTNIVFIVDKDSGDIVWQIGPEDSLTIGQHDAQMIPDGLPGAGNILIFDNGSDGGYPWKISVNYSRVIEVDPITKQVVWEYNAFNSGNPPWSFFSPRISGAQRLPNGNTFICDGMFGRLFEITADGEIVWEYVPFQPTKEIYRAYRVDKNWLIKDSPN